MSSATTESQQLSNAQNIEKKENGHDHTIPPPKEHNSEQKSELEPETDQPPKASSPANQDQEPEWISGFKLYTVVAAVTFVCFLMLLDSSIVVTAIPRITNDFHSLPDVGWYGSAYQLGRYAVCIF